MEKFNAPGTSSPSTQDLCLYLPILFGSGNPLSFFILLHPKLFSSLPQGCPPSPPTIIMQS